MKLVLRSDVAQVGKKGDIVDVSDGYGRNFLAAQGPRVPRVSHGGGAAGRQDAPGPRPPRRPPTAPPPRRSPPSLVPKVVAESRGPRRRRGRALRLRVRRRGRRRRRHRRRASTIDSDALHLDEPIKTVGTHLVPAKLRSEVGVSRSPSRSSPPRRVARQSPRKTTASDLLRRAHPPELSAALSTLGKTRSPRGFPQRCASGSPQAG